MRHRCGRGRRPPCCAAVGLRCAAVILLVSNWRTGWDLPLHLAAAVLLARVVWWAEDRVWWLAVFAAASIAATFWIAVVRSRIGMREAESRADQLAVQVDRRISELFSLQELSFVLSKSIQQDLIVDQVAKYAARFLQADGAIVALVERAGACASWPPPARWNRCWDRKAAIPRPRWFEWRLEGTVSRWLRRERPPR